ncbi:DUF4942 domain-containing protein (plasmid) [Brevundimonas olei]|uniref:DUF4942 domain-containing protein n=1 Tax=Brevundimonas olei TaxID=657642 RepID=A0ABZ2ILD9_9CAUL
MIGTSLALSAPIEKMDAHRQAAIKAFERAYDTIKEGFGHLAQAGAHDPSWSFIDRSALDVLTSVRDEKTAFMAAITKHADRVTWRSLMAMSGLERLMDATAKEQFAQQVNENPPPATAENCRATMEGLFADAGTIFRRGIATAFSRLDRRFRSHDGFKIGARIVLNAAFSEYGSWNHWQRKDDILRDVERAFYVLDGKQHPDRGEGIVGVIDRARPRGLERAAFTVEDQYFRVRTFKNGNAHIWFLRDDLVQMINLQLAEHYGAALGDASADASGPVTSRAPATGFSFFPTPEALVERVMSDSQIQRGMTVLEPSAGTGALAYPAAEAGALVTAVEIQSAFAAELASSGRFTRVLQDDFLQLTPEMIGRYDRVVMNPPFCRGRDVDHVRHALKFVAPGGLLVAIMAAGVAYREDAATVALRSAVDAAGGRIIDLPERSFSSVGTNVNTCLVTIPVREQK